MALNEDVKTEVVKKLEEYEGNIDHFYVDTNGYVTVGVGHQVPNGQAATLLILYKTDKDGKVQLATVEDKQTEYDNVAKAKKGNKAAWYEKNVPTTLSMNAGDITTLRDTDLTGFYTSLTSIYKKSKGYPDDFDSLPKNVQIALFDMIFNLGASGLVDKFPSFDKAIKGSDWKEAAKQSHRSDVPDDRNTYVKGLLEGVPAPTPAAPQKPVAPVAAGAH